VTLEQRIEALFASSPPQRTPENLALLAEFRAALNRGEIRVAEPESERWRVHIWVRKGILLHIPLGVLQDFSADRKGASFELDTLPTRAFRVEDRVRLPPGGSWIRDGAYLAPGVTCMPPVVVNMGAFVGPRTSLDSHVMVGLCAQLGERVQVSSGTQIGGVIAPLDRLPNVIGDDVIIGGNCGIYDGVQVGQGAVLGAGTILTGQSRVYDLKNQQIYRHTSQQPLTIPPGAVIVPGAQPVVRGPAANSGLMIQVPVIVGYRDDPQLPKDVLDTVLG